MQVLLDECLPRRLARRLVGHEVVTVTDRGWAGLQNGELLALAVSAGFKAFITIDQHLVTQQRMAAPAIVVVVLRAKSSRLSALEPLVNDVLVALQNPVPRVVYLGI